MPSSGVRLSRLAGVALAAWVGRWALREAAARLAHYVPPRPYEPDASRPPGRMPGPFDRR